MMMKRFGGKVIRSGLALALSGFGVARVDAAYVISFFDVPGAANTAVYGINVSGTMAGTTFGGGANPVASAFVYNQGMLQQLNGPAGAIESAALGIANTGAVVGYWMDSTSTHPSIDYDAAGNPFTITVNTQRGFIWKDGTYATINAPYAGVLDTYVSAVSPNGRYVLGGYVDASQNSTPFVLDTSTGNFTAYPALTGKPVAGINSSGHMVVDDIAAQARVVDLSGGTLRTFGFPNATRVGPRGINDQEQMAGTFFNTKSQMRDMWIGTAADYSVLTLPTPASTGFFTSLNNLGQAAGVWMVADGTQHGLIATPTVSPVSNPAVGVYQFSTAVSADVPVFIDPIVAIGYEYRVGSGDPLFKTISLPVGIGDNRYVINVGGQAFNVAGNEIFDLSAHGFAAGVSEFTVTGIEPDALLDPANSSAFVTRLTFMADGMFTGTQTALTMDFTAAVPEPQPWALWALGLAFLSWLRSSRRTPRRY